MKKIIVILLIAFTIGGLIGYTNSKKKSETKMLKEKHEIHNTETKNKQKPAVLKKDGITLIPDVPLLQRQPELDRGCEVTSLAMILQHAGLKVGKMELAKKIKKVDTPYKKQNGTYYYGNPNDGFVGDIYTFDRMGYGVYHGPVAELAEEYLPDAILDLTGQPFTNILNKVSSGKPVWIITNSDFALLAESEFRTWNTPTGKVSITWKEHSVVITGFDKNHVYINDPLSNEKNRKLPIENFKQAWVQMGSQAITYK